MLNDATAATASEDGQMLKQCSLALYWMRDRGVRCCPLVTLGANGVIALVPTQTVTNEPLPRDTRLLDSQCEGLVVVHVKGPKIASVVDTTVSEGGSGMLLFLLMKYSALGVGFNLCSLGVEFDAQ